MKLFDMEFAEFFKGVYQNQGVFLCSLDFLKEIMYMRMYVYVKKVYIYIYIKWNVFEKYIRCKGLNVKHKSNKSCQFSGKPISSNTFCQAKNLTIAAMRKFVLNIQNQE